MAEYTKYKIGDKVKVRRDLEHRTTYYMLNEDGSRNLEAHNSFTAEMKDFCEKNDYVVTIDRIIYGQYRVKEFNYSWVDEMFEGLVEPTDREKFKQWARKLSSLSGSSTEWCAFNNLTLLEPDDDYYESNLEVIADYLFGVEKIKMTKAEIEAKLGYKIEIVEE